MISFLTWLFCLLDGGGDVAGEEDKEVDRVYGSIEGCLGLLVFWIFLDIVDGS